MLPKAILFDLDDTIIAFNLSTHIAWKECCDSFVKRFQPAFDSKSLLDSINMVRKWYWDDPERHRTIHTEASLDKHLDYNLFLCDSTFAKWNVRKCSHV